MADADLRILGIGSNESPLCPECVIFVYFFLFFFFFLSFFFFLVIKISPSTHMSVSPLNVSSFNRMRKFPQISFRSPQVTS